MAWDGMFVCLFACLLACLLGWLIVCLLVCFVCVLSFCLYTYINEVLFQTTSKATKASFFALI